jgi:gluconate 2-dehydrogenase gamma chain
VQQDEILHDIESTPFFQAIRFDTIVGTFALPSWGGNRDYMGWHLLGFEHQMRFQPPFGYYDAEGK